MEKPIRRKFKVHKIGQFVVCALFIATIPLASSTVNHFDPMDATGIFTIDDLYNIRNNLTGDYVLMNDLDFQNNSHYVDWTVSKAGNTTGSGWLPIGTSASPFSGTFDGQTYEISNLFISSSINDIGLFGVTNDSEINDLGLINVNIVGTGTDPNTLHRGALAGLAKYSTITKAYATGNITSAAVVGGLVGYQYLSVINQSYANVTIVCSATSVQSLLGGLVGVSYNSIMVDSYAHGSLTGVGGRSPSRVGGLVGHLVRDSSGPGYADKYTKNCYAKGSVTGTAGSVGGLAGLIYNPTFIVCYWDTQTSGQSGAYGTTGSVGSGSGTAGKTTAQMYQEATYSGWDFDTIWAIDEGVGYPYLLNEEPSDNQQPDAPSDGYAETPVTSDETYLSVYDIWLNCTVSDPDGDAMDVSFYWGNDTLIGTIYGVMDNTVASLFLPDHWSRTILGYTNCTWVTHDTTHTWYAVADDGEYTNQSSTWDFHTGKAWDLNTDRTVNYLDVSMMVTYYNLRVTPPGMSAWDINEDTYVNYLDVSSVVGHYGETY